MAERSVLVVQNITREGPGIINQVLKKNNIIPTIVELSQNQELPSPLDFGAVVVLGGPDSANDRTPKMKSELAFVNQCIDEKTPYLGVCLGMQDLVRIAGGRVVKNPLHLREVGFVHNDKKPYEVILTGMGLRDPLFSDLGDKFRVFHLHGETVVLTDNIELLAKGNIVRNQIVKVGKNAYGVQPHFELTADMLETWLEEDPWLQEQDPEKVRGQFEQVKEEYTQAAWQLFTNFLRVANLI